VRNASRSSSTGTPCKRIWGSPISLPFRIATATEIWPYRATRRRSLIVAPSAGRITSPSSTSRPTWRFAELGRLAGGEADEIAIGLAHRAGNALLDTEARLLVHVADLAMDRQQDLRADPAVHLGQFRPPRMAGDMDEGLAVSDHLDALLGKLVHDLADRDLIARDLARGEDDEIALVQLES
jgi:hypothetical protein